ncbi:MAG: hypothetical protein FWH32_07025 [Clostridiales bacterium]|nr:hypothetical protein [Clostridiales bacterium]
MEYEKEFIKEGLAEEDLEAAAGGSKWTENRYNPDVCGKYTRVEYECVGFLTKCWCDHYRYEFLSATPGRFNGRRYHYTCVMGRYSYVGDSFGKPV